MAIGAQKNSSEIGIEWCGAKPLSELDRAQFYDMSNWPFFWKIERMLGYDSSPGQDRFQAVTRIDTRIGCSYFLYCWVHMANLDETWYKIMGSCSVEILAKWRVTVRILCGNFL